MDAQQGFVPKEGHEWVINEDRFERTELSKTSQIISRGMLNWLDKYSYEQRELFVENLFIFFNYFPHLGRCYHKIHFWIMFHVACN